MNEAEAKNWLAKRYEPEKIETLARFVRLLLGEGERQNLIAASTKSEIWSRHIVDSAQLLDLAPPGWRTWVDVGSGAGLPGIVIAILAGQKTTLVEPRRLRTEFLDRCRGELGLSEVIVMQSKAETAGVGGIADVVSARAVASLNVLFSISQSFASQKTTFILPKGTRAQSEVEDARRSWQGTFHVKQSIVDPASGIVTATGVSPR